MPDEALTISELLEQWRETTRAAELAERLATIARASVERSDRDAAAAREIRRFAEQAASHAERTARIAREAADRARAFATENRGSYLADAEATVATSREAETAARDRYHDAEDAAARDREHERGTRA